MATGPVTPLLTSLVDAGVLALLVVLACLPFSPAYGDASWWLPAVGGSVLGVAIGTVTARLGWHWLTAEAGAVVAYFLFGSALATPGAAIAGVFPSIESLRLLAVGVVVSWKQMLTVAAPVGTSGALLVPVLIVALVAGTVAASVCARSSRPMLAVIPPVIVMVIAGLLGTAESLHSFAVGTGFLLLALIWMGWRNRGTARGAIDLTRPLALLAVLGVAASAAFFVTPLVNPSAERLALRTYLVPPFDPLDYPSPLSAFRKYVKADEDEPMLTVSGLPAGGTLRIATLDDYTGVVYNVSTASGAFTKVGDKILDTTVGSGLDLAVTVDRYRGVWLPSTGRLTAITFDQPAETESFRYSRATGTGVVTAGLRQGDSYHLSVVLPTAPTLAQLASARPGIVDLPPLGVVPERVKAAAVQYTDGLESTYAKVEAIRASLASAGNLSHGRSDDLSSPSGHGMDRLNVLIRDSQMIGDQEQFAPTMALMVRSLGIPARVVQGFRAPSTYPGTGPLVLTGADMTAWVEVAFDGLGWVEFDPTPDVSEVPPQTTPQKKERPQPQIVLPPPPPADTQEAAAKAVTDDQQTDDNPDDGNGFWRWVGVGLLAASPIVLLASPFVLIMLLKARRRRLRRSAAAIPDRVAGGWRQLEDRAIDFGHTHVHGFTRRESARSMDASFGTSTVALADHADSQVFGPDSLSDADVDRFWREMDSAARGLGARQSRWRRLRARFSIASLRRKG